MILSISNSAINRMNILDSFGSLLKSKNEGFEKDERSQATPLPRLKSMLEREVISSSRITRKGQKYFHASFISSNKKEDPKIQGIKAKRSQTIADLKNSRMQKKRQQSKTKQKSQLSILSPQKGSIYGEIFKKSVYQTPINKRMQTQVEQKNLRTSSNLNYNQYEKIMTNQVIHPTHFQKIASRNDQKSLKSQFLLGILQASAKISEESRRKQVSSFTNRSSERMMLKQTNKLALQNKQANDSNRNIIGCKLGVLSNVSIRETIEEQLMRQQRQKMQRGGNLPTDESDDGASENQAKNQARQKPLNLKQILKKRKKLMRKAQKKLQSQSSIPQQFKQRFEQIMHKQEDVQNTNERDPQQVYQDRQQQMLYCQSIYHPKKYIMKHKVQWKV